jgi:glycosyltransferase involved in cell wall biosynthesis
MNLLQLTPGAGAMYCGNCLRDNALVAALRALGHQVLMVPLYLPLTLDEEDQSGGTPIFFSGINVYLEQKSALFRQAPAWFHRWMTSPRLLKWAAGKAAKTRAADVGDLTLSMLRGEDGNQARELQDLIRWLKTQPKPDVIFLSNVLLIGMAHRLRQDLNTRVVCMLQGEDYFLDGLPEAQRAACWRTVMDRSSSVDLFVAPTHYFGDLMRSRLGLAPDRVRVVYNGINLAGYQAPEAPALIPTSVTQAASPVLGYFTRMCREKGLHTLVEAYIKIRQRGKVPGLRLRVGGSCGPTDQILVDELKRRLAAEGLANDVEFCPNLDRASKVAFLKSLSVFSVPAGYGEAFGLYVIEALAAGVPVVQPRLAAFPELVEATGGGLLYAPGDAQTLAEALEPVLLDLDRARALGLAGQRAVFDKFSAQAMAHGMLDLVTNLVR